MNKYLKISNYVNRLTNLRPSKRSYAKTGEDLIIAAALKRLGITNPRYIDIGAWNPVRSNNTYLFYKQGSRGVLVEPNPDLAAIIRRKRPRDILLSIGVAPTAGKLEYHVLSGSQNNSFNKKHVDIQVQKHGQYIIRTISIPTMTLNSLLEQYPCDVLSLDAEQLDLDILLATDFDKYRPAVICVETLVSDGDTEHKVPEIGEYLRKVGYSLFGDTYVNSIFVRI